MLPKIQSSPEEHVVVFIVMTCLSIVSQLHDFGSVWRNKEVEMKVETEVAELKTNGNYLYFLSRRISITCHR